LGKVKSSRVSDITNNGPYTLNRAHCVEPLISIMPLTSSFYLTHSTKILLNFILAHYIFIFNLFFTIRYIAFMHFPFVLCFVFLFYFFPSYLSCFISSLRVSKYNGFGDPCYWLMSSNFFFLNHFQ
jgi:hypothetical protein